MNDFNKNNLTKGLNVLIIIIWALLTIATCSLVWNAALGLGASLTAGALFVANAIAIVKKAIKMKE